MLFRSENRISLLYSLIFLSSSWCTGNQSQQLIPIKSRRKLNHKGMTWNGILISFSLETGIFIWFYTHKRKIGMKERRELKRGSVGVSFTIQLTNTCIGCFPRSCLKLNMIRFSEACEIRPKEEGVMQIIYQVLLHINCHSNLKFVCLASSTKLDTLLSLKFPTFKCKTVSMESCSVKIFSVYSHLDSILSRQRCIRAWKMNDRKEERQIEQRKTLNCLILLPFMHPNMNRAWLSYTGWFEFFIYVSAVTATFYCWLQWNGPWKGDKVERFQKPFRANEVRKLQIHWWNIFRIVYLILKFG